MAAITSIDIRNAIGERQGLFTLIFWNFLIFALCRYIPGWEQLLALSFPPEADSRAGGILITVLRTLSYSFVHTDAAHLIENMFWLGLLGYAIYPLLRIRKFLAIYFAGAIAGALFFIAADYSASISVTLCGASAATMAVAAATLLLSRYTRHPFGRRSSGSNSGSPGRFILPLLAGIAILITFLWNLSPLSLAAHAGGAFAGAILAIIFRPRVKGDSGNPPSDSDDDAAELEAAQAGEKLRRSGYDSLSRREREAIKNRPRKI